MENLFKNNGTFKNAPNDNCKWELADDILICTHKSKTTVLIKYKIANLLGRLFTETLCQCFVLL